MRKTSLLLESCSEENFFNTKDQGGKGQECSARKLIA